MFAYCGNNPVNAVDYDGEYALSLPRSWEMGSGCAEAGCGGGGGIILFWLIKGIFFPDSDSDTLILDSNAQASNSSQSAQPKAIAGSTPATPPDPNGDGNGRSWKKLKERYLEKMLEGQDSNPHAFKQEFLGKNAKVSLYDVMKDTSTGQLGIFTKAGELVTLTNYFIKAGELIVLANYFG